MSYIFNMDEEIRDLQSNLAIDVMMNQQGQNHNVQQQHDENFDLQIENNRQKIDTLSRQVSNNNSNQIKMFSDTVAKGLSELTSKLTDNITKAIHEGFSKAGSSEDLNRNRAGEQP